MTTLYRTAHTTAEGLKNSGSGFGVKNLNLRHRNYSNSRLQTYLPMELEVSRPTLEARKRQEQTTSTNHSKELKKYCVNKFKAPSANEKFNAIRKNRSLKVMAPDPTNKFFNRTKL